MPEEPRYYINDTGTGNTLNLSHPRVLQMVTDSLRYWVTEMRVDGFRFDLATILAREPHGFDEGGGFLDSCRQDPVLSSVKLIAEPWDCGPGRLPGRQVSAGMGRVERPIPRHRARLLERRRSDGGPRSRNASRRSGDQFNHRGRRPWASVNFITAHDGFTLADLVSYDDKHNEANGEDNRDGHSDNRSWNYGVEGPTDDPQVLALRARQQRNFLATLLLAQGTPMLLAGDEFGRTQQGNNNAYCQDNDISWVDWELAESAPGRALTRFVQRVIALRNQFPVLRRNRFLNGEIEGMPGIKDVAWIAPSGDEMDMAHWEDPNTRCFGMLLDGRAPRSHIVRPASDATLMLILNAWHDTVAFTLPPPRDAGTVWTVLVDTAAAPGHDTPAALGATAGEPVAGRSLRVLLAAPPGEASVWLGDAAPLFAT